MLLLRASAAAPRADCNGTEIASFGKICIDLVSFGKICIDHFYAHALFPPRFCFLGFRSGSNVKDKAHRMILFFQINSPEVPNLGELEIHDAVAVLKACATILDVDTLDPDVERLMLTTKPRVIPNLSSYHSHHVLLLLCVLWFTVSFMFQFFVLIGFGML